jgi:hypothetical protein
MALLLNLFKQANCSKHQRILLAPSLTLAFALAHALQESVQKEIQRPTLNDERPTSNSSS